MNTQRLMSAFLLTGLLAAPALAFEVKPGEWEIEISGNGTVMLQEKICLSPEEAKKYFQPSARLISQDPPKDCKTNVSQSRGVVSFEMKCESGLKMKGTARSVSANEVQAEVTSTKATPDGKPPATIVIKNVVKRISATEVVWSTTATDGTASETNRPAISFKYLGPVCSKEAEAVPGRGTRWHDHPTEYTHHTK